VAATAGLLALGGLLLTGAGGMVLPPGRAAELLRALRNRFGQRADPEPATTAESAPATPADTMPTLVPLTFLEGASSGGSERAQRGPRSDGERILPPT
jgi:hypothetical protein